MQVKLTGIANASPMNMPKSAPVKRSLRTSLDFAIDAAILKVFDQDRRDRVSDFASTCDQPGQAMNTEFLKYRHSFSTEWSFRGVDAARVRTGHL